MRDYVIRRLLLVLPIMLGVSFLTFGVFRVIPGDACVTTLGFGATPETIKDCQVEHGLDSYTARQRLIGAGLALFGKGEQAKTAKIATLLQTYGFSC